MGIVRSSVAERVELLQKINSPYYRGLDESQLRQIAEPARLVKARAGEFLYHQGQPAVYNYLLLSGLVKILDYHSSGRPIIVRFIKPGLEFRFAHLGVASRYCAFAQAAVKVRALRWEMHDTMRLLDVFPSIALNSVSILQQMFVELIETLNWFAYGTAEERLFWVVRSLVEGLCEGGHTALPITQQELAASTGLSLYTVNRIIRKWERQELVKKQRNLLVVQPSKLRVYTDLQSKIG